MILRDDDNLTSAPILSLLTTGIGHLSHLRRELIDVFYLNRLKAPKTFFRINHSMSGPEVDLEIQNALVDLRIHFQGKGISRLADFYGE